MAKRKGTLILGDDSYFFEDAKITRAEYQEQKREIIQKNGAIKLESGSKVKKRIHYSLITAIQKQTLSVDRSKLENDAEETVISQMIEKGLITSTQDLFENKKENTDLQNKYKIAVVNEIATRLKKEIPNKFYFNKEEILDISKMSTNNTYHLEKVLNDMRSENSAIVTEKKIDKDFEKIYDEKMLISFITGYGYRVEEEPSLFSSSATNEIEIDNNKAFSFKDLPTNAKIIIEIHPDFLPYLINPHKNKYTEGYIQVFNKTINKFSFEHSIVLYKLVIEIKAQWQDRKFSYLDLLKRFPSNYGKKKKLNPKYTEDMPVAKKFLKNSKNEYIFELDRNQNFIYEEDYLKTYRFFKKEVLNPAIEEINEHSEYTVNLIEHRHKNLKNGLIEYVRFEIQRKKEESKDISYSKYLDISYYLAARVAVYNILNNRTPIENITKFAQSLKKALDEEQDTFFTNRKISNLTSIDDAKERVNENHAAIQKIKHLLFQNHKETSTLWLDEDYLVVFDKKEKGKKVVQGKDSKFYPILGEDAIQCWKEIEKRYPKLLNDDKKDASKDLTYYLPFEFYSDELSKFVMVTQTKLTTYELEIFNAIKTKKKNLFKGFKNMRFKKSFYENFFVL